VNDIGYFLQEIVEKKESLAHIGANVAYVTYAFCAGREQYREWVERCGDIVEL